MSPSYNMDYWKYKVAIVTGACNGIGAQITDDLLKIGMTVIGFEPTEEKVIKMAEKLENLTNVNGQLIPCKCDISKDSELSDAFEGIVAAYGGVDLLINNAVTGKAGLICTLDIEDMKHIIDVNIYGLLACTRFAIDSMVKHKKFGHIININSICGHYMPSFLEPKINLYITSKRTMTILNILLMNELKQLNHKIKVTSVSPGIVCTGLFNRSGVEFINEEFFKNNPHLTVQDVSDIVMMVLSLPHSLQVNEIIFHALNEIY